MDYAPVIPPHYLDYLPETQASFCYATIAETNPRYLKFFAKRKNVVLDHPIYERSDPEAWLTPKRLKMIVDIIEPRFTIIPDLIDDSSGTIKHALAFMAAIDHPSLTAVPQGQSMIELLQCAKSFYSNGIRRFGLSIIPTRALQLNRATWTELMLDKVGADCVFHWLGADYPYTDEAAQGWQMPQVLSLDTAEVFNASYRGVEFGSDDALSKASTKRPEGFEDLTQNFDSLIFHHNISWMQNRIGGNRLYGR